MRSMCRARSLVSAALIFARTLLHGGQVFLHPLQVIVGHVGDYLFGAGQGGGVHGARSAGLDLGLQGGRRVDEYRMSLLGGGAS